jgi:hypothetical protein
MWRRCRFLTVLNSITETRGINLVESWKEKFRTFELES